MLENNGAGEAGMKVKNPLPVNTLPVTFMKIRLY
jgi:hypothetical protein